MHRHPLSRQGLLEQGSTLLITVVFLLALFGFASLSIDVANVLQNQRQENIATDAAALAAVQLLTNSPQNAAAVEAEALAVAGTDSVTTNEIAAGSGGGVQVGFWNTNTQTFAANTTDSSGRWNAVRVPARRTVPMMFGKVIGFSQMTPAVYSVAGLVPTGRVPCAIPFGVSVGELTNKTFGSTLLLNDGSVGSGKQGKINNCDYGNTGEWVADMSTNACTCGVSAGTIPTITGNAQVRQSFQALGVGAIFVMPVVDEFDTTGKKPATIIGFVLVQITRLFGTGSNWGAEVTFLDRVEGTGGGGTCPPPCIPARVLLE